MKKQAHDRKHSPLVQLETLKVIPEDAKKAVDAFLQQAELQSGGVIEMLEKVLQDLLDEEAFFQAVQAHSGLYGKKRLVV